MDKKILVLHGPNLNLVGVRQPLCGPATFSEIDLRLAPRAAARGGKLRLSNICAREPVRRQSYRCDLPVGTICEIGRRGRALGR